MWGSEEVWLDSSSVPVRNFTNETHTHVCVGSCLSQLLWPTSTKLTSTWSFFRRECPAGCGVPAPPAGGSLFQRFDLRWMKSWEVLGGLEDGNCPSSASCARLRPLQGQVKGLLSWAATSWKRLRGLSANKDGGCELLCFCVRWQRSRGASASQTLQLFVLCDCASRLC